LLYILILFFLLVPLGTARSSELNHVFNSKVDFFNSSPVKGEKGIRSGCKSCKSSFDLTGFNNRAKELFVEKKGINYMYLFISPECKFSKGAIDSFIAFKKKNKINIYNNLYASSKPKHISR